MISSIDHIPIWFDVLKVSHGSLYTHTYIYNVGSFVHDFSFELFIPLFFYNLDFYFNLDHITIFIIFI